MIPAGTNEILNCQIFSFEIDLYYIEGDEHGHGLIKQSIRSKLPRLSKKQTFSKNKWMSTIEYFK